MAKTKARVTQQRPQAARPLRRTDSDHWNRILLLGGVGGVIALAVGIIAFGWYQTHIKPLGKTVLQVGTMEYDLGHLERRMRLFQDENAGLFQGEQLLALPGTVLDQLEREGTLIQAAGALNISVTEAEVDTKVRETGNLAEDAEASLFAQEFRRQVKESHLKPSEFRLKIKGEILQEKVRDYFLFLGPQTEAQVHARWIIFDEQEKADAALARLNAGEDFAAVATETTIDTNSKDKGGDLDWQLADTGAFPTDVSDFLFGAQPGQRSDVIAVSTFFYIAELIESDDNRALDDTQKQQVANRDMAKWIEDQRNSLSYKRDLSAGDEAKALQDVL